MPAGIDNPTDIQLAPPVPSDRPSLHDSSWVGEHFPYSSFDIYTITLLYAIGLRGAIYSCDRSKTWYSGWCRRSLVVMNQQSPHL